MSVVTLVAVGCGGFLLAVLWMDLIFDVQVHYLTYDLAQPGGLGIGMLFPQQRCGESDPRACYSVYHVIEEMFLKSDT